MPASVHELHRKYGNLNTIHFSSVGHNNVHLFENVECEIDEKELEETEEEGLFFQTQHQLITSRSWKLTNFPSNILDKSWWKTLTYYFKRNSLFGQG